MNNTNIFENIIVDKKNEQFINILNKESIRIEKIVSNGQTSPNDFWYDQEENEFVVVLEGFAIIEFEDKKVELKKGDYINIESHIKHRIKYTSETKPTIWLAIFY